MPVEGPFIYERQSVPISSNLQVTGQLFPHNAIAGLEAHWVDTSIWHSAAVCEVVYLCFAIPSLSSYIMRGTTISETEYYYNNDRN